MLGATISGGILDLSADRTLLVLYGCRLTDASVNGELFFSGNGRTLYVEGGTSFSTLHYKPQRPLQMTMAHPTHTTMAHATHTQGAG